MPCSAEANSTNSMCPTANDKRSLRVSEQMSGAVVMAPHIRSMCGQVRAQLQLRPRRANTPPGPGNQTPHHVRMLRLCTAIGETNNHISKFVASCVRWRLRAPAWHVHVHVVLELAPDDHQSPAHRRCHLCHLYPAGVQQLAGTYAHRRASADAAGTREPPTLSGLDRRPSLSAGSTACPALMQTAIALQQCNNDRAQ